MKVQKPVPVLQLPVLLLHQYSIIAYLILAITFGWANNWIVWVWVRVRVWVRVWVWVRVRVRVRGCN